jgi:8-oxo-dGTP diphosphatase
MSRDTADCAGALLLREGSVLLGLRSPDAARFPDRWDLLGGRLQAGESFADALIREVEEEAAIVPTAFQEIRRVAMPSGGMLALFLVTAWQGGEPGPCRAEHVELRWFRAEAAARLPNLVAPELADLLRELFGLAR